MSRAVRSAQLPVARSLVVHESRDAQVSFSLERVYTKMFDRLAPIVGATGVHALFVRAVERARADSTSVEFTPSANPRDAARPSIEAFERLSPRVAQDAASAVIAKFLSLLLTFMGSDLTVQILRAAFRDIDILPTGALGLDEDRIQSDGTLHVDLERKHGASQ